MTPWHRLKGKPWRVPLPCFGEAVKFKHRARHKMESRWRPGVFLGVKRTSSEKIVGDATGTYVVQSIRRMDSGQRWNATLFLSVQGTPWAPGGTADRGDPQELPQPISAAPELPAVSAEASKPYQRDFEPRRVYITRANLEQFGYTTGCPACDETRAGARSAGVSHTDVCRRRLEQALANERSRAERKDQSRRGQEDRKHREASAHEPRSGSRRTPLSRGTECSR